MPKLLLGRRLLLPKSVKGVFMKKLLIFIPIIATIAYLSGAVVCNTKFLPNTYINGVNVGFKNVDEAQKMIEKAAGPGEIELIKNDGTSEIVDLSSLKYTAKLNGNLSDVLMKQNSFSWVINLFQKESYDAEVSISYDTDGVEEIVNTLKCVTSQKVSPPQDAYITKTDNGYEIVPETEGTMIDRESLSAAIISAINNEEKSVDLSKNECYVKANVTVKSPEISSFARLLENLNNMVITYDFSDRSETLSYPQINGWITIEDGTIIVDEDKAKQYITNLAYKYDTYQKERNFTTSDGTEITVSGGIYGWQTDITKSTEELISAIKNCQSVTIQPSYKISGLCRDTDDIGDTYVEISIDKQHLWYYKDGELFLETDVVTGLPNGKRDTPKGIFCIWSREKDRILGSYAVQGYESHVDYWMPVDWTGVGLHDASWRNSFGGSIYKTNGSHGCINMPSDKAKSLYENSTTSTPVIIY